MFGLTVPISQSERQDEFDSVATILSHSSVARTSSDRRTPVWTNSLDGIDGVFHLELSVDTEAKLAHTPCVDGVSVSSLVSGMGCNSEDTGYSSDQELASPDNYFACKSKLGQRKKRIANKLDILKYNCGKITHRTSSDLKKVLSQVSPSAIHEQGKSQSDLRGSSNILTDHVCSNKAKMRTRIFGHIQEDDGVFLGNSDFRSSGTSSTSYTSDRSISSRNSSGTCSTNTSILTNMHSSDCTSNSVSSSSVCPRSTSRIKFGYKSVYIDIPSSQRHHSDKPSTTVPGVSLCEQILGITPACRSEVDPSNKDRNTEVIIKRILPSSPAINKPGISVGSVLHGINDQQITWDNMEALLCGILKCKKVKLTLKSLRSDSSPVDLETLVNILTSGDAGSHSWGQVAAMYISLDAVDSNSQDARHDGLVYSFPSQQNSLHQLSGLFYTLPRLVRDLHGSGTIRNTTLCCDGQETLVAYMEEGCDILVFASPVACVAASQLNAALTEFSRLVRVLFTSVGCAFRQGQHWVLVDSLLHYLFKKVFPGSSTKPCLLPAISDLTETRGDLLPYQSLMRFSGHFPAVSLPDDIVANIDTVLSEFESSTLPVSPGNSHESRRKYTILGSAFFHRGQLVSSHLAPADLHDLGLYLQHLGLLDFNARNSVAQFVAWKEVYPTRFCQDIAEINSSFGYSEPNARWCFMIVGLKHGLLCSLLETVGPTLVPQDELLLDVFNVDMAKSCLMRLQTPQLLAMLNVRVSVDSQSALAKSDYCATYVNTAGEKTARLFGDDKRIRASHSRPLVLSLQPGQRTSPGPCGIAGNAEIDSPCKYPHAKKMYPVENDGPVNSFLSSTSAAILTRTLTSQKLSTSRHPSIYQYCYLDGLEGTVITGSDVHNSGIFHSQIITNFYKCCRQIHNYFVTNGGKENQSHSSKGEDDDDSFEQITSDPNLRGMKEHGILMNFNHHEGEEDDRQRQSLEYWVIGRRMKHPSIREMYVCCHASASQSVVELAFRLDFGSIS